MKAPWTTTMVYVAIALVEESVALVEQSVVAQHALASRVAVDFGRLMSLPW